MAFQKQVNLMRYPTYSELIFINGRLLGDKALQTGKKKVRDVDMLLAAVQRPEASAFGQDAYPTLTEKAAVLLHAVARNHPFADGNKRTATVGALFLLMINGKAAIWEPADALERIVKLAEGHLDWPEVAAWLVLQDGGDPQPEADLARDTMTIDQIIDEQKWLLDELAER